MGNQKISECIITGLPATEIIDDKDAIEYQIEIGEKKYRLCLEHSARSWHEKEPFFQENLPILQGLLVNDKWFEDKRQIITIDKLKELIKNAPIPKTPQEKLDRLFLHLFAMQEEDGQFLKLSEEYKKTTLWKELYFKSFEELKFYIDSLHDIGLIEIKEQEFSHGLRALLGYQITLDGLDRAIQLKEDGDNSNKCFIAMAFDDTTKEIRAAIKKALIETNYVPIIVDEKHIESDKTINDEIIASLKSCKFCIADFTYHKNGVYFEAGYALGRGKKVIYTCSKKEFENAHFDIRPLQHIIYDSTEELKEKLIFKIKAWIEE